MIMNIIQYIISWTQECEDSVRACIIKCVKKLQGAGYNLWVHIFLTQSHEIICRGRLNHIYFFYKFYKYVRLWSKSLLLKWCPFATHQIDLSSWKTVSIVILTTCSSLAAPEVVIMTTPSAVTDENNYLFHEWHFLSHFFLKTIDQYVEIIVHTPHTGIMILGKM